jgi:hypothetical protein
MARKNIKMNEVTWHMHNERRQYYGLSWAEYMDAGCPRVPDEKE